MLGPGLLESVSDAVWTYELGPRGLRTTRPQPIPVIYEGVRIDAGFRADLIDEDKVIVEIKSVEVLAPVHRKQLLTCLRLADKPRPASSRMASHELSTGWTKILTRRRQAAKRCRGRYASSHRLQSQSRLLWLRLRRAV
jgi:GxxExxY protein